MRSKFGKHKMKKLKDVFLENVTTHHPDLAVSVQLENEFD